MTKQEYLSQAYKLEQLIQKKQLLVNEYESLASISGIKYDGVRLDGNGNHETTFLKWMDKVIDLKKEIEELQKRVELLKAEIVRVIEALKNYDYITILVMRYLKNFTWLDVCDKLYISRATAYRWHDLAISLITIPN